MILTQLKAWGFAIIAALLLAAWSVQTLRLREVKLEHAVVLRDIANKTAAALVEARARDAQIDKLGKTLASTIKANEKEAQDAQREHNARLARADARAASLHDQLATISGAYTRARDKAASASELASDIAAAHAALGVLAELYRRSDQRAGARAAFADAAHASGARCERDYDAAEALIRGAE